MAAITTRSTAGSGATAGSTTVANAPLTNTQVDTNFINLNNDIASRLLATGGTTLYLGSQANSTRFPNALASVSNVSTGAVSETTTNIGIIGEGAADATRISVGVYGVGYTSSANKGTGIQGEGHVVNPTTDTTNAVGVRGYSTDVRSGTSTGLNIALFADASGALSNNNYALYMNTGNILSNVAQTWTLGGNLTFSGAFSVTIPTLALTNALSVANGGTGATTLTGLVKGNGASAFTAAVSGTDYQAPIGTISGIAKGNGANLLTAAVSGTDYAPGTSALATGIVKSTTSTGALSIAVANTDYLTPPTGTAMLKAGSGGALAAAVAGTDYQAPVSATGILKSSGVSGNVTAAVAGTDYQSAQSVTGMVKSSGVARSAAVSGTDYAPGTSALATGIVKSTTSTGALSIAVAGTDYVAPSGSITGTSAGFPAASVAEIGRYLDFHGATTGAADYDVRLDGGAGNGTTGSQALNVTAGGGLICNANITAFSDERIKDNITIISNALEKVNTLRGVTFTRTDLPDTEQLHTGVIAQDVLKVLPEAVTENQEGIYTVAYGNMVGLLIEAIKELTQEIEVLKGKI